jgi:hypothetical protein
MVKRRSIKKVFLRHSVDYYEFIPKNNNPSRRTQ